LNGAEPIFGMNQPARHMNGHLPGQVGDKLLLPFPFDYLVGLRKKKTLVCDTIRHKILQHRGQPFYRTRPRLPVGWIAFINPVNF
jgi:hypothetical protein